jgi:hypothetical protein
LCGKAGDIMWLYNQGESLYIIYNIQIDVECKLGKLCTEG